MKFNISIITAVYNGESTIRKTIKSLHEQDYHAIEHVIVDGGSTDGTIDIIKGYDDKIAKFISEPDNGLYDAMNKGIRLATGDYVATLNSDDFYPDSSIISKIMNFIESNNLDAVYGDLEYFRGDDVDTITRHWRPGKYKKGMFHRGWVPPHPTFFCKRELFEKYGYFRLDMPYAADFELMFRFIEKHKIKVGYLPQTIVKMRMGGKTNTLKGIIKSNFTDMIKSFHVNGYQFPIQFFPCKFVTKLKQYKTLRIVD